MLIRTILSLIALTSLLCFTSACSSNQKPSTRSTSTPATTSQTNQPSSTTPKAGGEVSLEEGQKLFKQYCSACHGPDAKGLPNLGKNLRTSSFVADHSVDELITFVKKGRGTDDPANTTGVAMPPKGGNPALNDDQIRTIISWVKSINGK